MILYETRQHASKTYTSNYPPQSTIQSEGGARGFFSSLISSRGVSQLRERWSGYRQQQPRKVKRLSSLFVSASGERVAVAAGNQITVLRKEDDYRDPYGIFRSSSCNTFTSGTWSELHDVLGVADDAGTIYFIKANGEEISRITQKHLKTTSLVVGLLVLDDSEIQRSCLFSFTAVSADGSFHHIEISRDSSSCISSSHTSYLKGKFSGDICCVDHYPKLSLFVVVSSVPSVSFSSGAESESCYITLWRECGNSDVKQSFSIQFEGLYGKSKGSEGRLAYPKVLISPEGEFVATLDVSGFLHIFRLDREGCSLTKFACKEINNNLSNGGSEFMNGIADFTWWSNSVLTLVKRSGLVTMVELLSGLKVLENDVEYSAPVVERVQQLPGHLFLLECKLSGDKYNHSRHSERDNSHGIDQIVDDNFNQVDCSGLRWSLISFSERSVSEMYDLLIRNKNYQAALDFAHCHGLDKDNVMKSQWLRSSYGVYEIDMYLLNIKDKEFVLSECVDKVGPTEDAVKALLEYGLGLTNQYKFSESEDDSCSDIWDFRLARLRLLQFKDRLETYLGINMGRFSVQDYIKFRAMPTNEAAGALAESGKIGALNLLLKRHPYSLTPYIFNILAAIPETVSAESYRQLLPGKSPPSSVAVREEDWVECEKTVHFINVLPENYAFDMDIKTEPIIKRCQGFSWPSAHELTTWYKNRARDIDSLSGLLDNSLCLIELACQKGFYELQKFCEDILYLHQLVYSGDSDDNTNFSMSLVAWEQLSDYEKFRMMLNVVKEGNLVEQLCNKAIPFMKNRFHEIPSTSDDQESSDHLSVNNNKTHSFLVRWLKEIAIENKLDMCLMVIDEGCKDFENNVFFKDQGEAVDCALQCIYLCTLTDKWGTMADMLSKLPPLYDNRIHIDGLEKRLKLAESHIEAGRLLAFYQVPKPINFFLEGHSDIKAVKQIIRLILSKFSRRQPGRSDNEWANMWRDMQSLREKAFPFVDLEFLLVEYCRGLLKAGKFSLARNYLKGTASTSLAPEKAEAIVIQAAREYFFSSSSLSCPEIWKAKECLDLFPTSRNVKAEADIIDALTVHLPCLGLTILPLQYRQIKDPMEIINMAITNQAGAYMHVDELIEVAKLLGLRSSDAISAVEEAIAREAAVAGDLQLAFDLCLVLTKKGHGSIWDLCAAIARGPALENMDINSRKQLLGFALSYCDEESIAELLHAWKDLDMQGQCETIMMLSSTNPPNVLQGQSPSSLPENSYCELFGSSGYSSRIGGASNNGEESCYGKVKEVLSLVAKRFPTDSWGNSEFLGDNGKLFSFALSHIPWLLELSRSPEHVAKLSSGVCPGSWYVSVKTQSLVTILSWLARNGLAPSDHLIALLAKTVMESPSAEEDDIVGLSILLNLVDPVNGVDIIEEKLKTRKSYLEVSSAMNIGMKYSLLHSPDGGFDGPTQRRELLLRNLKEKHTSDEKDNLSEVQSSFWRDWKLKLEEQKREADHSKVLERVIPGVEPARFLSGDVDYMEKIIFSLIDSVKLEKKRILGDVSKVAENYGLNCTEVLLRYLSSVLLSEAWTDDDIMDEISNAKGEIISHAADVINNLTVHVYPAIDGCNKQRLAYVYSLLSECYLQLEKTKESLPVQLDSSYRTTIANFYNAIAKECRRVSFIQNLNFKNIAGLHGLNADNLSSEVYAHIDKSSLEALAEMVQTFAAIYDGPMPGSKDIYMYYVSGLLKNLEDCARAELESGSSQKLQNFLSQLEQTYDSCRAYFHYLARSDVSDVVQQFFRMIMPLNNLCGKIPDTSAWQECLILLLSFWIRLTEEMDGFASHQSLREKLGFEPVCLMSCLKMFIRLVVDDTISPAQGWGAILNYISHGFSDVFQYEIFIFLRSMVLSGCGFGATTELFSEVVASTADTEWDLPSLYVKILECILQDLVNNFNECQYLYNLMSSLSKLEGNLDSLKSVREVVWERMSKFSNNLELPSQIRVHILEIMQFVSGGNVKGLTSLQTKIFQWEGWDALHCTIGQNETAVDQEFDTSNRFTSTLVALKSTQLATAISPDIEITPDHLSSIDAAVSCFLKLCAAADLKSHMDALITILEEWEGLFVSRKDEEVSEDAADAGNNWSHDDWDEGWESFQEVEPIEKEKEESCPSIHPLHICWVEIFKKLIASSLFNDLLRMIDQSVSKCSHTLLDEDGAMNLSQILLGQDCFLALKMVLLLPYKAIHLQCLVAVEDRLKQEGVSEIMSRDLELLMLVLSSGLTATIITQSCYGATFSYICYVVGNLSRQSQAVQISIERGKGKCDIKEQDLNLFRKILFPSFVSELVKADQQILAGFLVTKYMHTNSSLSLLSIAEASLYRYLKGQLSVLEHEEFMVEEMDSHGKLWNAISSLRFKLIVTIQSVLPLLSSDIN